MISLLRIAVFVFLLFLPVPEARPAGDADWTALDEGLSLAVFREYPGSPYVLSVLRIDPARYELELLSSVERGRNPMSLREWCGAYGLTAAINASMYLEDGKKSTGYMRNFDHVNNPRINAAFGAFLVFHPVHPDLPAVQIVDREQGDWEGLIGRYRTVVQNYRLITLTGRNAWSPPSDDRKFQTAAVGIDDGGSLLFIFSREPRSVHDFANRLLTLPLGIRNAMYVEGGQDAGLFISRFAPETQERGDLSLFEDRQGKDATPSVPNVIGIRKIRR
jgi:hypothetical protein